jgi:hypothetical protein
MRNKKLTKRAESDMIKSCPECFTRLENKAFKKGFRKGYSSRSAELENKPTCDEITKALDQYRKQLFDAKTVKSTQFMHMQTALHYAKNIVRYLHGEKGKSEIAWIK